ncbi:hypothetical protein BDV98DRAFT_499205, partial [Pterulicium gracile]
VKREHQTEGINSPITRWRRGVFLVSRLKDGPTALSEEGLQTGTAFELKELETQHWYRHSCLVDVKHRYGSNCLNYLVKIGKDGKLLWAKNNQPVDTSSGRWKDSGDGRGILPETAQDRPERVRRDSFETVSSFGSLDSEQENQAWHYADDSDGTKKHSFLRRYFTLSGLTNRLLKKTVSRNTWIYVTVSAIVNLFVGIKGASHYDRSLGHFHQFLECMRERGVDMRKARVSKAEAALWWYVSNHF